MKNLLLIFCIIAFISCNTPIHIQTETGNPEITWDGKILCIGQKFTAIADTNELAKGVKVGDNTNYIIAKYSAGKISLEGHGCYQLIK